MKRKYKITLEGSWYCIYRKGWFFWYFEDMAFSYKRALEKVEGMRFEKILTLKEIVDRECGGLD